MSFKNNVRYLRTKAGLTQEELAQRLRVTQATISQYENGEIAPRSVMVKQIAEFFKVNETELLK